MNKFLPFPATSLGLFVFWVLLNQSLSPGTLCLGGLIAVAGGRMLAVLDMPGGHMRKPGLALRLLGCVLKDIVLSNMAVARIILGLGAKPLSSGFVNIPLDLRAPYGLAALSCIITSTPGTLWVDFDEQRRVLTIHVLDLVDEAALTQTIKTRYEKPLVEIFS
jgi:multicomponent K+:H+ antiporter subunit E